MLLPEGEDLKALNFAFKTMTDADLIRRSAATTIATAKKDMKKLLDCSEDDLKVFITAVGNEHYPEEFSERVKEIGEIAAKVNLDYGKNKSEGDDAES